jgi:hypothetical protein
MRIAGSGTHDPRRLRGSIRHVYWAAIQIKRGYHAQITTHACRGEDLMIPLPALVLALLAAGTLIAVRVYRAPVLSLGLVYLPLWGLIAYLAGGLLDHFGADPGTSTWLGILVGGACGIIGSVWAATVRQKRGSTKPEAGCPR